MAAPVVSTKARRAARRDLLSTISCLFAVRGSLRSGLRPSVETTGSAICWVKLSIPKTSPGGGTKGRLEGVGNSKAGSSPFETHRSAMLLRARGSRAQTPRLLRQNHPPISGAPERCQSGRSGRSRKPLCVQAYRGFESHPLRHLVGNESINVGSCRSAALPTHHSTHLGASAWRSPTFGHARRSTTCRDDDGVPLGWNPAKTMARQQCATNERNTECTTTLATSTARSSTSRA
jgi:hypothetical protein